MISRSLAIRSALGASVLALGLSGCGSMMHSGPKMETYTASLSGAQEVPAKTTAGTGSAEVSVDPATMTMKYKVTYSGLTGPATAGHIHGPAGMGKNAGVVIPFPSAASPIEGQTTLTAAQYADLKAGNYYVNIHTAANPGGEIRGQLAPR